MFCIFIKEILMFTATLKSSLLLYMIPYFRLYFIIVMEIGKNIITFPLLVLYVVKLMNFPLSS